MIPDCHDLEKRYTGLLLRQSVSEMLDTVDGELETTCMNCNLFHFV